MLELYEIMPLGADFDIRYAGVCAAKDSLFFLSFEPFIYKNTMDLIFEEKISVKRAYRKLCFDPHENCFFACDDALGSHIYKLDENFGEIDCLNYNNRETKDKISGVFFDENEMNFLVTYADRVERLYKDESKKLILNSRQGLFFLGAAMLEDYMVTVMQDNKNQGVTLLDREKNPLLSCYFPPEFVYEDITVTNEKNIYILAKKHRIYPYILKYRSILAAALPKVSENKMMKKDGLFKAFAKTINNLRLKD